jgi:CDP-paratose 2-epimerase
MRDFPAIRVEDFDIRDRENVLELFRLQGDGIEVVVHSAAQPSHDWAGTQPFVDFDVNASGTLNLLEAARLHSPSASFLFMSTNKVYGDRPNLLPLQACETRWKLNEEHEFARLGISETMSIDATTHSLFGASKASADLMVQEYGRYFGMKTAVFRAGCITGGAHAGAKLHGFLAFLVKSVVSGQRYTVIGHKGKQVRDNIHAADLAQAFVEVAQNPSTLLGGDVFNMGGGYSRSISPIEALNYLRDYGFEASYSLENKERLGDHIWWVTDTTKFSNAFPNWKQRFSLEMIFEEHIRRAAEDV